MFRKNNHKTDINDRRPPRLAEIIVSLIIDESTLYTALGDYEEEFHRVCLNHGYLAAASRYWLRIIGLLPVFLHESIEWSLVMIRNYCKLTFRNLLKHKSFFLLNILGLALSMAVCLMIIIFVKDQKSSDRFHEHKDRVVRIITTDTEIRHPEIKGWASTPAFLAPYLEENTTLAESTVRLRRMSANALKTETALGIGGMYADPTFLTVFSYPLLHGDPSKALDEPFSMVISQETAFRLFGTADPMNQTLTLEDRGDFRITGVLKTIDEKSHFSAFDALISFSTLTSLEQTGKLDRPILSWESFSSYYTYVLLKEESSIPSLEGQLEQVSETLVLEHDRGRYGFEVQPLLKINLGINLINSMPGTQHSFEYVYIPFLAALVIFLACFNYIILSIARSLKRTEEIGLRKVIGARRGQIVIQFMSETFIVTFFALIASCLLLLWFIPAFNGIDAVEMAGMQMNDGWMSDLGLFALFLLFAVIVSVLAGIYPAFYLSSFLPAAALQGTSQIKVFSRLRLRKILMGIQFGVSLTAIVFIAYFFQLQMFWANFDQGIRTENVASVSLQGVRGDIVKNELIKSSRVTGISLSSDIPIFGSHRVTQMQTAHMEEPIRTFCYFVDPGFIRTFDLEMIAGRNLSDEHASDVEGAVLVNEKALRALDLGTPAEALGKAFRLGKSAEVQVIGVVRDFHFRHLENPIEPLIFQYSPDVFSFAHVTYSAGSKEEVDAWLADAWKRVDKLHPVRVQYMDDLRKSHENQMKGVLGISVWACGFIIAISLMGLLGLALYTAEMRVKEIGIRKVLGSSVASVAILLSGDSIRVIFIAAMVALPAGYCIAGSTMQFFAFRPRLSLWVLPAALLFILTLALITVGSQTIKAAFANPAETLKYE